jgi:mono/diheme cytochrome c family protein
VTSRYYSRDCIQEEGMMRGIRNRRRTWVLGFAIGSCVLVSCTSQPAEESKAPPPVEQAMSPLKRGEYLAMVTGCHDCHTPGGMYGAPDMHRALSGSELGWQGPWGISYAANLTPDSATGIGSWTAVEIERALRSGVKKDGSPVLPPMPWPDFTRLSPEDMAALTTYLKNIPAVRHAVPPAIPPGGKASGAVVTFPPPPVWDAPKRLP